MKFGSVCSGIEAASVAWEPLGWNAAWFSEIEPFPCAVLAHRYPDVPNLGDMTAMPDRIRSGEVEAPDVFCGGTPCQAFSVAGKRQSLDDARGNLSLVFCEIANAIDDVRSGAGEQPTIIFWENVPGVLSTKDNAFGCFLGELAGEDCAIEPAGGKWTNAGCVYGPKRTVAWRVLDAQYFGVAQRRRRVFVVASARTDIDPAAILFEFDGLRRDTAPCREKGEIAPTIPARSTGGGGLGTDFDLDGGVINQPATFDFQSSGSYGEAPVAATLSARDFKSAKDLVTQPVAHAQVMPTMAAGAGTPAGHNARSGHTKDAYIVPAAVSVALRGRDGGATAELGGDVQNCLRASSGGGDKPHVLAPAIGWDNDLNASKEQMGTLLKGGDGGRHEGVMLSTMAVRRLTPVECERLQGFPDGWTMIPWRKKPASECPDGPRYKALGNSWAVPNVRWIGERIQLAVEVAA